MSDFEDLDEHDRALAQRLRAQLRASEELDYVTQAKLSAARARAVAVPGGSRPGLPGTPAGGWPPAA